MRSTTPFDFSPLFRSFIGFDRLARLADTAQHLDAGGFPPHNVIQTGDDAYEIEIAVAGFTPDDLRIDVERGALSVSGKSGEDAPEDRKVLHRGIAKRAFVKRFQLAEHVEVRDARIENGLLRISLARVVPEEQRARRIPIAAAGAPAGPVEPAAV